HVSGLAFLNEISGDQFCSRLYGSSIMPFILVEEEATGQALDHILQHGTQQQAESALMAYATTLGRIHSLSFSRKNEYFDHRAKLSNFYLPTPPDVDLLLDHIEAVLLP